MLWATRRVKCPDGRSVTVFRDPSRAFPLALKTVHANAQAAVEGLGDLSAKVGADIRQEYETLLIRLNRSNSNLQSDLNATYVAFASDPCFEPGYLPRRFRELQTARERLEAALIQVDLLGNLLKSSRPSVEVIRTIRSALLALQPQPAQDLVRDILGAPDEVARWRRPM
jgi:hypothetical protein